MNNIKLLPNLLVFAEVARQGSFTMAAKYLKISKSSASQQITRLEEHVGVQLLTRNTRGLSLTAFGEKLLTRSELLKDQVELAMQELVSAEQTPSGPFSITMPHVMMKNLVAPALKQLCIEYPNLEPRLIITDEPLDLIRENLDVAIFVGKLRDSNYRALLINSFSEIFCASPAYIEQHGIPKTLDDLANHHWISAKWQEASLSVYSKDKNKKPQKLSLTPYARCNVLASAIELARQDMGIVLVPEIVADALFKKGEMRQVLNQYHGKEWPVYLLHPFQGEKPLHVTRFYQLVKCFLARAKVAAS